MANLTPDGDQLQRQLETYGIFEGMDPSAARTLTALGRQLELSLLDYMTIRDLVGLGGHQGDGALCLVLMIMFAALQEGSLCLDLDGESLLSRFAADLRDAAADTMVTFASGLAQGKYERLITSNRDAYVPLISVESGDRKLLYFQRYYTHENRLKNRIEAFLKAPVTADMQDEQIHHLLEEVYSDPLTIRVGPDSTPIRQDPYQIEAIRLALGSQFAIISGGPGTGKTYLTVNILRCLVRAGISASGILLAAPTGRAAQRMTETLQQSIGTILEPAKEDTDLLALNGSTLHKILKYRSFDHAFTYGVSSPLPASVVVIDEVSMVDVVMLAKFLEAVDPGRTKLILLGDKDQLPSVEAGAVLAEMIPDGTRGASFRDRLVLLRSVHRSGSNLMEIAAQTNRGTFPEFAAVSFEDALSQDADQWAFTNAAGFDTWQSHLHQWADHQYLTPPLRTGRSFRDLVVEAGTMAAADLLSSEEGTHLLQQIFRVVARARILTLIRNGIYGSGTINALMSGYLAEKLDTLRTIAGRQAEVFSGSLVIITRNDYTKELFNGDVGIVLRDTTGIYRAFFQRSASYSGFPVSLLPSWEPAFAMTVHKSQGSEFDDVLLVLPDDANHRLLTREIIYTGMTRARSRVLLYGSRPALDFALQRKVERQSGLLW